MAFIRHLRGSILQGLRLTRSMMRILSNMKIDIPPVISQVYDSKMVQLQITIPQIVCIISTIVIFLILLVTPMTVFSILNHIRINNLVMNHSNSKLDIEVPVNGCNLRNDCGK